VMADDEHACVGGGVARDRQLTELSVGIWACEKRVTRSCIDIRQNRQNRQNHLTQV
jgi:hypothetical protein